MQKTLKAMISRMLVAACLLFAACATVEIQEEGVDHQARASELRAKLTHNPGDEETLRDLGIACFHLKQYLDSYINLKRATELNGHDAKALFYFGMMYEYEDNITAALALDGNYTDVQGPYRQLMEGRYRALSAEIIRRQFQRLLANEKLLTGNAPSPEHIAIFPLTYVGPDQRYAPLGKGLSEMISVDLGAVKTLMLVERTRVETLLDELKLGQSRYVDIASAPRMGKLLSAGRLVAGTFSVSESQRMSINVASWDAAQKESPRMSSAVDDYGNLFRLEKEIVFSVLKNIGVTLTNEEREEIQRFPTHNLQAFLLYSMGLEKLDAGDYKAAGVHFNQAAMLDPGFTMAKSKSEAMQALSVAGGTKEAALAAAQKTDSPQPDQASGRDLIRDRLLNLGNGIGSGFYPGQDDRRGAQDAGDDGVLGGVLPLPPPPPAKQ